MLSRPVEFDFMLSGEFEIFYSIISSTLWSGTDKMKDSTKLREVPHKATAESAWQ